MFNRNPNMVEVSGLTVQLDDLHKAYVTIFEEAQRQLEAIDLTDAHIYRITERLGNSDNVTRKIQSEALTQLANALNEATAEELEGERVTNNLLDALETRIWARINSQVEQTILTIVNERIDQVADTAVKAALSNNPLMQQAVSADLVLTGLRAYMNNAEQRETTEENTEAAG